MRLTVGATCIGGGSKEVCTGVWRQITPVVDQGKCVKCGICAQFCPDCAINVDKEGAHVDLFYCKGCGICANECHVKAITMEV